MDHDGAHTTLVPPDHGLLLQLVPANEDDTNGTSKVATVSMAVVPNQPLPSIHPNGQAPASLHDIQLLYGGGSGTAVFGGHDASMGHVVMKHAGAKDAKEIFSLATIASELEQRQCDSIDDATTACHVAADNMARRIPTFRMVYISPCHLRDRGKELWAGVRNLSYRTLSSTTLEPAGRKDSMDTVDGMQLEFDGGLSQSDLYKLSKLPSSPRPSRDAGAHNGSSYQRTIQVTTSPLVMQVKWAVSRSIVHITLPTSVDGLDLIQAFGHSLSTQLQRHHWKVTLGQKWIGGLDAVNGADVLTSRALVPGSSLLQTLLDEFTAVMDDLHQLTRPEERTGPYAAIQPEVRDLLDSDVDVTHVSKRVDVFLGRSIVKNFHPQQGRFVAMRQLARQFQHATGAECSDDESAKQMLLLPNEQVPARFLARLLVYQADQSTVFEHAPSSQSALDAMQDRGWRDIVRNATQFTSSDTNTSWNDVATAAAAATECLWTCGLTDAGLHNSFLSLDRGLELFDLGEPNVQPRPAFLIKFLMSFFHTLGMEDDGRGLWKVRFTVTDANDEASATERLVATPETLAQIPYLHEVFTTTLDHFMTHMFQDDPRIRTLLLKYVVLQLLSDASFCLQRWTAKGGGTQRVGDRNTTGLEKWLWRSLWDHYIASYVYSNLLLPAEARLSSSQTSTS